MPPASFPSASGRCSPFAAGHFDAAECVGTMSRPRLSTGSGVESAFEIVKPSELFLFEPHQTEMCGFVPTTYVDISEVFPLKMRAMEAMKAQQYLRQHYAERAEHRANQARRITGRKDIRHAEAFQRVYPQVIDSL